MKKNSKKTVIKKDKFGYLALTLKSILMGLGFYFLIRIIRNNFYFPIITPLETVNPPVFQILRYLGHILFIVGLLIYFYFVKEDRHTLRIIKFRKKDIFYIVFGLIFGFVLNGANVLVAYLHGDIDMVKSTFDVSLIFVSFLAVFIQAFAEEMQYRMWIQERIKVDAPVVYAIIGSAFAFAWSHMLNEGVTFIAFVNLFLHGILYSLLAEISCDIWFAASFHAAWNITQNFIFGLPNSGYKAILTLMAPTFTKDSFCYDSIFGVEGTKIGIIINVLAILILYYYIKYKHKNKKGIRDKE